MLFRKNIEKSCAYCVHSAKISDDEVLCIKKGVVELTNKCRSFSYDPCKRTPAKAKALDCSKFEQYDFSL